MLTESIFAAYWEASTRKGANTPVSAVRLQTAVLIAGTIVQVSTKVATLCPPAEDIVVISKVVGATVMVEV
jgi:hypothetical protein